MSSLPRIENGNIILRRPLLSDIDGRANYGVSAEYARLTGTNFNKIYSFNLEDATEWYERIINHPCKWVIEYKNLFIGVVSLRPNYNDNKGKFAIEIYNNEFLGLGIGSKVTRMVLAYAFNKKKYHKVFLRVLESNERALNCYKKCGFIQEGIDREGALVNNKYESDIYMGILSREYRDNIGYEINWENCE